MLTGKIRGKKRICAGDHGAASKKGSSPPAAPLACIFPSLETRCEDRPLDAPLSPPLFHIQNRTCPPVKSEFYTVSTEFSTAHRKSDLSKNGTASPFQKRKGKGARAPERIRKQQRSGAPTRRGRARPLPVAEEGSAKEWQRSKKSRKAQARRFFRAPQQERRPRRSVQVWRYLRSKLTALSRQGKLELTRQRRVWSATDNGLHAVTPHPFRCSQSEDILPLEKADNVHRPLKRTERLRTPLCVILSGANTAVRCLRSRTFKNVR